MIEKISRKKISSDKQTISTIDPKKLVVEIDKEINSKIEVLEEKLIKNNACNCSDAKINNLQVEFEVLSRYNKLIFILLSTALGLTTFNIAGLIYLLSQL